MVRTCNYDELILLSLIGWYSRGKIQDLPIRDTINLDPRLSFLGLMVKKREPEIEVERLAQLYRVLLSEWNIRSIFRLSPRERWEKVEVVFLQNTLQ